MASWIHGPTDSLVHWFIELIHWFIDSLTHSLSHWLTDYRLTSSLVHWFIQSLVHLFIHVFTASLAHWVIVGSLIHLLTTSSIHWFTGSLVHWFIDSRNHSCIDSLLHCFTEASIHWFIGSLNHRFIDSLIHRFIGPLVTQLCSDSLCHFTGISTTIYSFVDAPHNFNRSWFLHLKSVPIGHGFPIDISYVRNFRPGACRALGKKLMHKAFIPIKVLSHYVSFTSKKRQENIMQVGHMRRIRDVWFLWGAAQQILCSSTKLLPLLQWHNGIARLDTTSMLAVQRRATCTEAKLIKLHWKEATSTCHSFRQLSLVLGIFEIHSNIQHFRQSIHAAYNSERCAISSTAVFGAADRRCPPPLKITWELRRKRCSRSWCRTRKTQK